MSNTEEEVKWSREDVQRVLYHVVCAYEQATFAPVEHVPPRRFEFLRRRTTLGGDSELLRDAIRIACQTLEDNNWWPPDKNRPGVLFDHHKKP